MQTKYVSNPDDTKLAYYERYNQTSKLGIVFIHGLGEHKGRYDDFINQIYDNGFSIFALDIRGHGESDGERGFIKEFDDFISDLDCMIQHVKQKYPSLRIVLMGHSLGGLIATGYVEKYHNIDLLVLSNPLLSYPLLTMLFHIVPYKLIGHIRIKKIKSESQEMLNYSLNDPLACNYFTLRLLGSIFGRGIYVVNKRLKDIKIPVLLLGGELDPVLNHKRLYKKFKKFGSHDKELKVYKGLKHRLLQSPQRKEVTNNIIDWILRHIEP
ncbi:MAG: lysophospholipase [Ruminococcus sp.]|nr:lysophospholipase [Ruminococcus sp.]